MSLLEVRLRHQYEQESSHGWLVNLKSVAGLVSLHELSGQDGDRLTRCRRINYADCLK
jgi:hypothetical protein